jgi:hypothetical protein
MPKEATKCPITKETFKQKAMPVATKIGDVLLSIMPKEFSTGSFGFYGNGKVTQLVNGVPVVFQTNVQMVAIGSKA